MTTFKIVISDSNFPTVTMSYYISAATQADAQAFLDSQYSTTPNITTILSASDIGAGVPTTFAGDLTVSNDTQTLFKQHLIIGSNSIVIGTDASLIGI